MSSWREKLSGLTDRAKEVASGALISAKEAAIDAGKSIKNIATSVHNDVANVMGETLFPNKTADAVTTKGEVYTVAIDAGYAAPNTGVTGGAATGKEKRKSEEEQEKRELQAMIPTHKFMGNIRDEISDVYSIISGGVQDLVGDMRNYWNATKYRASNDYSSVKGDISRVFNSRPEHQTVVTTTSTPVNPHAPTVMNIESDDAPKSPRVTPKRPNRPIPSGKLAYNGSGTGTEQLKYKADRERQKAPKPPKGPEGSNNKYKAVIAALAVIAGGLAVYIGSESDQNTTSQIPTASASNNVAPKPTTTENKTTKIETPAPTSTREPEPPKTEEVDPPKEVKWTAPKKVENKKRYAKRSNLPKKETHVSPQPKKETEQPKSDAAPTDYSLRYNDAKRISAKIHESLGALAFAAGETDLGRAPIIYEQFNSYSGPSKPIELPEVNSPRGSIMNYIATADQLARTYDANIDCLDLNEENDKGLQCDGDHVWSLSNLERLTKAAEASQTAVVNAKLGKQSRIAEAQKAIFQDLYSSIELSIAKIRDSKQQDTLRSRLITISARMAMVGSNRNTETNPVKRMEANELQINKIRGLISHAELLRGDAARGVVASYHYKLNPNQNRTATNTTKTSNGLRSLQNARKAPIAQNTNDSNENMKVAPVWTPDSI